MNSEGSIPYALFILECDLTADEYLLTTLDRETTFSYRSSRCSPYDGMNFDDFISESVHHVYKNVNVSSFIMSNNHPSHW